jgi:amino acid transporter
MVFAILAFCGFDVVSTLAEETKMPETIIPKATILSLLVYAGIIIAGIWALSYGATREQMQKIAEGGQMPISEVARMVWGKAGILIPITGLSATLGLAIATAIGSSRILFSMARGGLAPLRFASLSEVQAPAQALHVIFALALIATLFTAIFLTPYDCYVWWGTSSTFFAMITYLLVNGANLVLNRKRWRDGAYGLFAFLLIPAFGFIVDAYLLYRTFFFELWHQEWATGKSVLVVDVLCAVIALVVAVRFKREK